jgi:hypothetical protein
MNGNQVSTLKTKHALSRLGRFMALQALIVLQVLSLKSAAQVAPKKTALAAGETLTVNQALTSNNNLYRAIMQNDGNFVVYKGSAPVWASNSVRGAGNYFAAMQGDGNFVLYLGTPQAPGAAYWASNTAQGAGAYQLSLGDDGSLALYRGTAVWNSRPGAVAAAPAAPPAPQPAAPSVQPAFPITGARDDCFPGSGGCMHTNATLTRNPDGSGHINAVTRTSEMTMLRGFKGSVAIAILDENHQALWVSETQNYGVDGTAFGTHDRTDNWVDTVPAALLPHMRQYAIIQKWNPNNVFTSIKNWLSGIKTVADELAGIATDVKTIVSAVSPAPAVPATAASAAAPKVPTGK